MNSLDPRVNRLTSLAISPEKKPKAPLDQLGSYEVFVEPKEGKPFQHEGALHAASLEMAYVFAKEAFTRRFTCTAIFVCDTRDVFVSAMTEGNDNVYDHILKAGEGKGEKKYEIFHLNKRGKQHVHMGAVMAATPQEAMGQAKGKFDSGKVIYNIWVVASEAIRFTTTEERDIWNTLPDKKFRDAADYKGGDKLKSFLEKQSQ